MRSQHTELQELIDANKAKIPKHFIHGPGKIVKAKCITCDSLVVLKGRRARKIGAICTVCKLVSLKETIDDYREQIMTGVPQDRRMVITMPYDLMWWYDREWDDMVMDAIKRLDIEARRSQLRIVGAA